MTDSFDVFSAVQGTAEFSAALLRLARRGESDFSRVEPAVREILEAVKREGDRAVMRFVETFEGRRIERLLITDYRGREAFDGLEGSLRRALSEAATRIHAYHERQRQQSQSFEYEEAGVLLGSRVTPVDRAGVYVPGGKANYPSSVLMCAIPAKVAGVAKVYLACPQLSPEVRAACHLAGVDAVVDAGGAQAIAAFAYGTESVPRVEKIVGPGNLYVAAAKRLVFGEVDIDSIAGPSEILVLADESADAVLIAADLLSQAEHDEAAYPLLLCTTDELVRDVRRELSAQLATLPRRTIAERSLSDNGMALVVRDRNALAEIANQIAAEHVAIHTEHPRELADHVARAGAIFIGSMTPEAAGDYLAGPSHVLPTGGAARYAAPLGVYDFVSRTSLIRYERAALEQQGSAIGRFARAEGLEAHARAVEARLRQR
jgi:histidinol dehydrogenase